MLHLHLKSKRPNVVCLDGDGLRAVFGGMHGHSPNERRELAMSYARLCQLLSGQDMDVICSTVSMFHDVRAWNRSNIPNYREIYIKVPMETLIERDQKKLYSRALRGEVENVMGMDLDFEEPINPDVVVNNDGSRTLDEVFSDLLNKIE